MNWTYSGDPASSPLDEVRFLVGDTDPGNPELQDAEIAYTLTLVNGTATPPASGNYLAASYAAEAIAARYKRLVDKSVGDLHIAYSQLRKSFLDTSARLRSRAALTSVPMYVGGLSRAAKDAQYADEDLLGTATKIDGMDYARPVAGSEPDDSTGH